MKKLIAVLCMMAIMVTAILPVMAEQKGGMQEQPPKMGQGGPKGHGENQTPPEKPEGDLQPGGKNPPSKPGDSSSDDAKPADAPRDSLRKLVEDGTLSQTTYDAIREYMKNNAPSSADSQTPPEKPEDDSSRQPPEKPDGENAPAGQRPGMLTQEMLKTMLEANVITEEEYNTLLASTTTTETSSEETTD